MLVGLMAMAALPPLNGFAGEWVIYQSFFKMSTGDLFIGRLLGPLLAVGLAISHAVDFRHTHHRQCASDRQANGQ